MCLYAGDSVQRMTGHNMQNHSQRRRAGRNCKVGEGTEEHVCVGLEVSVLTYKSAAL